MSGKQLFAKCKQHATHALGICVNHICQEARIRELMPLICNRCISIPSKIFCCKVYKSLRWSELNETSERRYSGLFIVSKIFKQYKLMMHSANFKLVTKTPLSSKNAFMRNCGA